MLRTVAGEFMDRPLEVIDSIQRMDVVESARRMLFNEHARIAPSEAVDLLCDLGSGFEQDTLPQEDSPRLDAEPEDSDVRLRYVDSMDEAAPATGMAAGSRVRLSPAIPTVRMRPGSQFRDIKVLDIDLQSDADRVEREVVSTLEQPLECGRTEPEVVEEPQGLSGHFPEFTSLAYGCPLANGVELAMDKEGRLRLLCRDADIAQARVASSWAVANEALIRMATGGFAPGALSIMIDVVTDDATRVTDLHHTGVRLYLLSRLQDGGSDQWFRAELNTEESSKIPG